MEKKSFILAYDVKFAGLKLGKHVFDFHVNDEFLSHYEDSLVTKSDVDVILEFEKQSEVLYFLNFELKGKINLTCDRCLTHFDLPIDDFHRLVMKVDSEILNEMDDEIIYVSSYDHSINVADHLYEFILMQIPLKVSCDLAELECDEEMMSKLEDNSYSDNEIDEASPWAKLQDLKNKLKE